MRSNRIFTSEFASDCILSPINDGCWLWLWWVGPCDTCEQGSEWQLPGHPMSVTQQYFSQEW